MKTFRLFFLLLPVILVSCEKTPYAGFHIDTVNPEVGQEVFFINDSQNSNSFEWDFGDGFISNEINPSHVYMATGTFEVKLTSYSDNGYEDVASMTIRVLVPTLLVIEVREYYDQYVVPDASVILYPTLTDWDGQTNSIAEGFTNSDGVIVFSGLDPFVHYVDVWEKNHDNYGLRSEDAGFVRTPEVLANKINFFTAWVDIVDHGKGTAKGSRQIVIKKLERSASVKGQPEVSADLQDWKKLFEQSINHK
jgi:PKD repeat protein